VIINHEEETIWSIPVTKGEHHELETLYDFKAVNYFQLFELSGNEFSSYCRRELQFTELKETKSATLSSWST
jgi:hypothetical protein